MWKNTKQRMDSWNHLERITLCDDSAPTEV